MSGYIYCYKEWENDLQINYKASKVFEKVKRYTIPLIPVICVYSIYESIFMNTGGV